MDWRKTLLIGVLALALTLWSASQGIVPLPDPAENFAIAVVGMVALVIGTVVRAILFALMPLLMVARMLALPAAIAVIVWLALRRRRA